MPINTCWCSNILNVSHRFNLFYKYKNGKPIVSKFTKQNRNDSVVILLLLFRNVISVKLIWSNGKSGSRTIFCFCLSVSFLYQKKNLIKTSASTVVVASSLIFFFILLNECFYWTNAGMNIAKLYTSGTICRNINLIENKWMWLQITQFNSILYKSVLFRECKWLA